MPHFDYLGFDQVGQTRTGVIEAATANEAVGMLAKMGLRVQKVTPALAQQTGFAMVAPATTGTKPDSVVKTNSKPSFGGQMGTQETMFLRDSQLFILFSQLANLFRSGISPVEAMNEMSNRHSWKPFLREIFIEVGRDVSAGRSLADAMERFPDIFPPGAIGAVRAGETGGYLPMACQVYAENQQNNSKLRGIFKWLNIAIWSTLISIPLFNSMMNGVSRLTATINNMKPPQEEYLLGLREGLFGIWGIFAVIVILIWAFGWRVTGRRSFLNWRHKLAATTWGGPKRRSRMDSLLMLGFHMKSLSRAGLSPARVYALAADAVPNRWYAEELKKLLRGSTESTKLSTILRQSPIIPEEQVQMIETGEMTGTVESTIDAMIEMAEADRKSTEGYLKFKAFVWVGLITLGSAALMYGFLSRGFFDSAWDAVFEGVPGYDDSVDGG